MKPFRYKLQAVQMLRERREHEAAEQYALALALRAQALQRLGDVEHELSLARFEIQELVTAGCPAHQVSRRQQFCVVIQDRRTQCASDLQSAERTVQQRFTALLNARQDREAVEKHHDKCRQEHQRGLQREEQRWLDDLSPRPGLAAHA
ncbi:MAG TPA: flagellar export protein FliJ [Candidatus Limnocylindria bacterium]|nr:flagellar export protein FliJ [Candidatus Limnocylindria bacterium]